MRQQLDRIANLHGVAAVNDRQDGVAYQFPPDGATRAEGFRRFARGLGADARRVTDSDGSVILVSGKRFN